MTIERFDAVDDPDLVDMHTWEYLHQHWWVCVFRPGQGPKSAEPASAHNWAWCRSVNVPRPVPNPQMMWRRPTYGEALARVVWIHRVERNEVTDDGDGSKYAQ